MTKQTVSHRSTMYTTMIHNRRVGVQTVLAVTDVIRLQYLLTVIASTISNKQPNMTFLTYAKSSFFN